MNHKGHTQHNTCLMQNFQRHISHTISFDKNGNIVLRGTLKDVFHDIVVEFLIEKDELEIIDVTTRFHKSPTEHCCHIEERMMLFIGEKITPGLTRTIIKILGGAKGCGNLYAILVGLLPLAVNAKAAAGLGDPEEVMKAIQARLTGTCAGYPEEVK